MPWTDLGDRTVEIVGSVDITRSAGLRRDSILQAVTFAAEQLLLSPAWEEVADDVLAHLGDAAGVSRVYIIENVLDAEGRDCSKQRAEWCAPGIASQITNPILAATPWEEFGFGRWVHAMRLGEHIASPVDRLPDAERHELESQDILSIASFPVAVDGEWWGLIGFDDCEQSREWTGPELDALRTAATVLGAAIQRRRADQRASESERRYRALVENVPVVFYVQAIDASPDGFYLSPQAQDLFGYDQATWMATPGFWHDHIHPDDRESTSEANRANDRTREPFVAEYRFRIADDSYRWIHEEAVLVLDDDGEPLFWQGVFMDITRRKEAEGRLRSAEHRYRVLVEHIPAVVYVESPDADPERFYLSPQVRDVFGYPADEWRWTEDFWIDHVHPDDRPDVVAGDERTNDEREVFLMEYRFRAADGTWRWVHDEAVFVKEPDGSGYWQGFMQDITERKAVEDQLREAELKFRTIVEQNQAIFYTQEIDPSDPTISYTTYIAPGNTDLMGYTLEEIQHDPQLWRKVIHPEDRERVLAADAESNTGGEDRFSMEYRMIAKDGRIVWLQDEATLVRIPGRSPYWQGFLLDITERKLSEEQLARALTVEREAARRLRAVDEMKNTFLQAVSHDLRTPLAAILGLAITLERGDVELEANDARDLAGRIAENARRLDRLVTNLLDMDRLARGIVSPKLAPVDVGELVRSVTANSDLIAPERVTIDVRSVVIPVDAAKIERIVENLLANTARHTPSHARIWVTVRPDADGALIAVDDNGVGVPEDLRETIFEPFRQGPEAPQHSPGVGVGLTLVRRFAELHGGRAWIEERPGGGASFRVFLPSSPSPGSELDERGSA